MLGFTLAALGLASSWKVAGTTVATLILPILILAVPILDTTLVTVVRLLEGRPISQGGRDHTSHRLVYHGLSERRAVVLLAAIAAALGTTSLAYNVIDDAKITTLGVLLTFVLLVQFASFLGEVERSPATAQKRTGLFGLLIVHRRRLIEVPVDAALIGASFYGAYVLRLGSNGSIGQRTVFIAALPVLLFARYLAFIPFGLYRGVWRYAGARDAVRIVAAVLVSEVVAFGFISATRSWDGFPRNIFVIDALLCIMLVGGVPVLGACSAPRARVTASPRPAAARPRRRRRAQRPQPGSRVARDDRGARGRLRRRRSKPVAPATARRSRARQRRRDATNRGRSATGRRTCDDPERTRRATRVRAGSLRRGPHRLSARPSRDRSGSIDLAERVQQVTKSRLVEIVRRLARAQAAIPVLTIFVWLCLLYGWEAWGNLTPWLFTDELEKTQLSRAIAETGHAARRTVPHSFDTLYVYLIAPAWFVHNTTKAYGVVKAIGVGTMTSVLFPTYLLARMLVSKRWALFAAAGAAMIPVLSYSSLILEEALAYPYAALCFYLLAKAFVTRRRGWIAAASLASIVAPLVRDQLAVITAGAIIAAAAYWFGSEGGLRLRANWGSWDWVGLVVLLVLFASVFDVVIAHKSSIWYLATQYYKGRMVTYGLWAAGALTIGLGVLPTIAGLSSLVRPRGTPQTPERRAFTTIAISMFASFGFYTAVKAAYISTIGFSYLTERNLVYVAPLLFIGTAIVFDRGRAVLPAVVAASAFAMYVVTTTPYKMESHFYFDAPGLSVLQSLNRVVALTPSGAKVLLVVLTLVSAAFLVYSRYGAPRVVTLLSSWRRGSCSCGTRTEITGARSSHAFADRLLAGMPRPLNWVDQTVPHGADVYYLGQQIADPNGVELLEFWNRSIHHVWSTDASAPGPGPSVTPDVKTTGGLLFPRKDVRYLVTDYGLILRGKVLAVKYHTGAAVLPWTLYRVTPPLRLQQSLEGLYADGWGAPLTAYNQYSLPGHEKRFSWSTSLARAAARPCRRPCTFASGG